MSAPCLQFTGGCFKYPVSKLQRKDTDLGLSFYVLLFIYNNAGHFTTLKTQNFILPSSSPPGHVIVSDIDPETYDEDLSNDHTDIDAHFSVNTVCAKWNGLEHPDQVSFEIGLGSGGDFDDIYAFTRINSTSHHCVTSLNIPTDTKLFFSVRATNSAGSTTSRSDGLTIYRPAAVIRSLDVLDGPMCFSPQMLLHQTSKTGSKDILFRSPLLVGKIYTLRISGQNVTNINVSSMNLHDSDIHIKHIKDALGYTDVVFQPRSAIQRMNLLNNYRSSIIAELYECEDDLSAMLAISTLKAHWRGLSDHFTYESAAVKVLCSDLNDETCYEILTPFISYRGQISSNMLTPKPQDTYCVSIKPCLNSKCLKHKLTSGVYIEPKLNSINIVKTNLSFKDENCTSLETEWEPLKNVVVSFYQWSIASASKTDVPGSLAILRDWKTVLTRSTADEVYGVTLFCL